MHRGPAGASLTVINLKPAADKAITWCSSSWRESGAYDWLLNDRQVDDCREHAEQNREPPNDIIRPGALEEEPGGSDRRRVARQLSAQALHAVVHLLRTSNGHPSVHYAAPEYGRDPRFRCRAGLVLILVRLFRRSPQPAAIASVRLSECEPQSNQAVRISSPCAGSSHSIASASRSPTICKTFRPIAPSPSIELSHRWQNRRDSGAGLNAPRPSIGRLRLQVAD